MVKLSLYNDIGNHNCAGNRALSGLHQRHPHTCVAVDHSLDLLGMDLETPNVDDPVSSANEIVAIAPEFEHIAGIDETVLVREGPIRAS